MAPEVPLADRVNVEPPIINGASATEVTFIFGGSVIAFFALGALLWALTGFWVLFAISMLSGPMATTWTISKHLAVLKRNRPDGYHVQLLNMKLASWHLRRSPFVKHAGWWSVGRTL
jgi:conjugative transfer region protein (TIGR03750 family)